MKRPRSEHSVAALGIAVAALLAFAPPAAARFDYESPCASAAEQLSMLQPLLPPGRDPRAAADGFSIRIVPDAAGFLLDVRAGDEDDFVRQLRDPSCAELVRAAAQIVALTIEDAPPPPEAVRARLLSSGALQPREAAREQPLSIGVELTLVGAAGLLPGLGIGNGPRVFFDLEGWSLTLGFRYWFSQAQELALEQRRVSIFEGVAGLTWRARLQPGWSLGPQLEVSGGAWVAESDSASSSKALARATLGASFLIALSQQVHLELRAAGVLPLSRPGYTDPAGVLRFRPAPFGVEGGAAVRFVGFP